MSVHDSAIAPQIRLIGDPDELSEDECGCCRGGGTFHRASSTEGIEEARRRAIRRLAPLLRESLRGAPDVLGRGAQAFPCRPGPVPFRLAGSVNFDSSAANSQRQGTLTLSLATGKLIRPVHRLRIRGTRPLFPGPSLFARASQRPRQRSCRRKGTCRLSPADAEEPPN